MRRETNRFSNYVSLTAKFDSIGNCNHPIKKGESIGWNRRHGAKCQACWLKWSEENREAEAYENRYSYVSDSY